MARTGLSTTIALIMTGFPDVLERLRSVPTERLVEVLGEIHRQERPSPFALVPSAAPPVASSRARATAPLVDSPLARTIPVAPASPTDQALHDLLEHRAQQSVYAAGVQRFLSSLGATDAEPLPQSVMQQLVPLRPSDDGARGVFVVHNPRSLPVSLTVRIDGSGNGSGNGSGGSGLFIEPESAILGAGESRPIELLHVGPEPGFGRDVRVELDGELVLQLRVELLDASDEPDGPVADHGSEPPDHLPRLSLRRPDDELTAILREAQLLLLRHPLAAQALFRSVVAEGRRFARTEEGQRIGEQLADSELIRRGRVLWEVGTLQLLEEEAPTMLPSKLLDAFVQAANDGNLERSMIGLFGYGAGDGHSTDPASD